MSGYELDAGLRALKERIRKLELAVARNRPGTGSSFDGTASGSVSTNLQGAIDELFALVGSGTAADVSIVDAGGYFTGIDVEAALQELAAKAIGYQAHGAMGATETFNAATGWHSGTFDANCTFSLTGALPSGTVSSLFLELAQNGTGGWTVTLPASVVNRVALEAAQDTTAGTTSFLVLLSRDGGTPWYGGWWGGSVAASLIIKDEGIPLATAAESLDFAGAGVVASGAGVAKTITIPGIPTGAAGGGLAGTYPNPTISPTAIETIGHYELLMAAGSSPISPLETGDGLDWLYVWVPG